MFNDEERIDEKELNEMQLKLRISSQRRMSDKGRETVDAPATPRRFFFKSTHSTTPI